MMRSQRVALGLVCLLGFQLFAATASAQNLRTGIPDGNIEVRLENVVQRVLDPATEFAFIDMAPFPDGTGRMAVSTIQGTIRVMDAGGNLLPDPLMTSAQSAQFLEPRTPPNEAGMTGIAFHPDFNNAGTFGYGKLYTITSDRRSNLAGGVPLNQIDYSFTGHSYQMLLREWNLATFGNVPGNAANNAFTGATSDSRELLRIAQPGKYHTLFDLAFNTSVGPTDPDYGNLYFTYGDGGDEAGIRTNADRANAAQGLSTIYGKIHRIDPDPAANPLVRTSANTGQPAYSIPADNPYNGDDATESRTAPTLAEIWANGVRSPWRLTFDRGTGDLYLGDVGENQREEVNRIERGKNYGWGQMEGTLDGTLLPGDGRLLPGLEPPLIEMPRGTGSNSVSGGFVYRGSAIPDLVGKYVFADLGQGYDYSAIFYAIVDPNDPDGEVGDVFEFKISPLSPKYEGTQLLPERIFSLGEDLNGEIYLVAGPDPRNPFVRSRPSLIIRLGAIPEPSTALLVIGGMTVVVLGSRRGFVRSSALQ